MADLPFKINIEAESGKLTSYGTGSFAKTDEADISGSGILARINAMVSLSYSSNSEIGSAQSAGNTFSHANNIWVSASYDGGPEVGGSASGSITFHHTDTEDSADRLKRYRFFGTKVCNVLGLPEGHFLQPSNFKLDDSGGGDNYFSGDISATNLSVSNAISFSPLSTVTSNLRWNIDKTSDLFVQFTSGSGAFRENLLLIGYDTEEEKLMIRPHKTTVSSTTIPFNIGGVELSTFGNVANLYTANIEAKSGSFSTRLAMGASSEIAYSAGLGAGVNIRGGDYETEAIHEGGTKIRGSMIIKPTSYNAGGYFFAVQSADVGGTTVSHINGLAIGRTQDESPVYSVESGSIITLGPPLITQTTFDQVCLAADAIAASSREMKTMHIWPSYHYGTEELRLHMDLNVSGSSEIIGGQRAYFSGGEATAFNLISGATVTGRYLDISLVQMGSARGYRMMRAGSITGVSQQFACSTLTDVGGGTLAEKAQSTIQVRVNGSIVFSSTTGSVTATGNFGSQATQARGIDNFAAGDIVALYAYGVNQQFVSTFTVDEFCATFEVTYDS